IVLPVSGALRVAGQSVPHIGTARRRCESAAFRASVVPLHCLGRRNLAGSAKTKTPAGLNIQSRETQVMTTVSGKTALVTGASRGIGRASALALAKAGARVLVHYANGVKQTGAV